MARTERGALKALRRLFLDGLMIAIPLAVLVILVAHVVHFFREVIRPLVSFLPVDSWVGMVGLTLAAVLAIVLVVLFFGLIVRWKARGLVESFERKVLNRIPIYQVLKRVSTDIVDPEGNDHAVLVDTHGTGAAAFGLLIEDAGQEQAIVFLPDAPSATTGSVFVVPKDRIRRLDASGLQVIEAVGNRGMHASDLLPK